MNRRQLLGRGDSSVELPVGWAGSSVGAAFVSCHHVKVALLSVFELSLSHPHFHKWPPHSNSYSYLSNCPKLIGSLKIDLESHLWSVFSASGRVNNDISLPQSHSTSGKACLYTVLLQWHPNSVLPRKTLLSSNPQTHPWDPTAYLCSYMLSSLIIWPLPKFFPGLYQKGPPKPPWLLLYICQRHSLPRLCSLGSIFTKITIARARVEPQEWSSLVY